MIASFRGKPVTGGKQERKLFVKSGWTELKNSVILYLRAVVKIICEYALDKYVKGPIIVSRGGMKLFVNMLLTNT